MRAKGSSAPLLHVLGIVAIAIGLVLAVFKRGLLPERFFFDEERILLFIQQPQLIFQDGSYAGTTAVYLIVGGLWLSPVAMSVVTYAAFFLLIQKHFPLRTACTSISRLIFYSIAVGLGGIYIAGYTKEAVLVILLLLFPRRGSKASVEVVWFLATLAYAASVREYWFITLLLYFAYRVLSRRFSPSKLFVVSTPLLLIALSLAFRVVLDVDLHWFRTSVLDTLSTDPDSAIVNPLPSSSIGADFVNGVWSVFVLALPLPLIGLGVSQAPAAIFLGAFWVTVLWGGRMRSKFFDDHELRLYSLAFAYLITLSLFEPDYGSYLRHITAVLPVLLPLVALQPRLNSRTNRDRSVTIGANV